MYSHVILINDTGSQKSIKVNSSTVSDKPLSAANGCFDIDKIDGDNIEVFHESGRKMIDAKFENIDLNKFIKIWKKSPDEPGPEATSVIAIEIQNGIINTM